MSVRSVNSIKSNSDLKNGVASVEEEKLTDFLTSVKRNSKRR